MKFLYHQQNLEKLLNLQYNLKYLSYVADFSNFTVKSTTETSIVGILKAIPVNLPFIAGITFPTAFAAPVEEGITLPIAERPPLQSFTEGPSTVFCVDLLLILYYLHPLQTLVYDL